MLPITMYGSPNKHVGRLKPIAKIVIHDAETLETAGSAEGTAQWFKNPAARSSAHYTVDADSIAQSVADSDTAWHCPGSNADGLGIEHAGVASQTAAQWNDNYSRTMLDLSARLTASLALRYGIPARWLTDDQIRAGAKGFHTHGDATRAFGTAGGHTDPGPHFPRGAYIEAVARYMGSPTKATAPAPVPSAVLQRGSTGKAVADVQAFALRVFPSYAKGIASTGGADGVFGAETEAWVKEFQHRSGLPADGIVGPLTWAALKRNGMVQ